MNILGLGLGGRFGLVLLTISVALAVGCSVRSASDDDDDDEDGDGGTSSVGGTFGRGGTAGNVSTGGTGSGQTSCVALCARVQMCPNVTPVDCATDCREMETEAASLGCTTQYRSFLTCVSAIPNACDIGNTAACDSATTAYISCINGLGGTGGSGGSGGSGGGNCPGGGPVNVSCSAMCARLDQCPSPTPDCLASCSSSQTDAATTGCTSVYQQYLDCTYTCSDICLLNVDDCVAELSNFATCLSAFCNANPSATPCL